MRRILCAALVIALPPACATAVRAPGAETPSPSEGRYLIIRADDFGMAHAANRALERLIETGFPLSASLMPPTPWVLDAVEVLKRHPEVAVGIHLTLNSEWRNYRWGPVLGPAAVPSLVDEHGYFFPSAADLYENEPDLDEVERELRAQIERMLRTGLRIDYVDYHMGTATGRPEFREITERLAREFGLGMSGYFGETMQSPQYAAAPESKLDSLTVMLQRLEPGYNTVIVHVGLETPEMDALVDMNVSFPLPDMSRHRHGELRALTSPEFARAVDEAGVTLITYRDLIARQGLASMRRPE
jgi:chitin disaccharide deacetylase